MREKKVGRRMDGRQQTGEVGHEALRSCRMVPIAAQVRT